MIDLETKLIELTYKTPEEVRDALNEARNIELDDFLAEESTDEEKIFFVTSQSLQAGEIDNDLDKYWILDTLDEEWNDSDAQLADMKDENGVLNLDDVRSYISAMLSSNMESGAMEEIGSLINFKLAPNNDKLAIKLFDISTIAYNSVRTISEEEKEKILDEIIMKKEGMSVTEYEKKIKEQKASC